MTTTYRFSCELICEIISPILIPYTKNANCFFLPKIYNLTGAHTYARAITRARWVENPQLKIANSTVWNRFSKQNEYKK